MSDIVRRAAMLADRYHAGQVRKYNGTPYVWHPGRVAMMATLGGMSDACIAAAWLHDTLEDTSLAPGLIAAECGDEVLGLVRALTNYKHVGAASRAERKRLDRDNLSRQCWAARTIKALDRADNLLEMGGSDPEFLDIYKDESVQLLKALGYIPTWASAQLVGAIVSA